MYMWIKLMGVGEDSCRRCPRKLIDCNSFYSRNVCWIGSASPGWMGQGQLFKYMNNTVLMSQNIFDAEDVMVDTITSLSGCSLLTSAQTAVQKGSTIHSVE